LRGTTRIAWIQEGKIWASGINLEVLLLRRRADLDLSIICCKSPVSTQRYGDDSSRKLGSDCRERDGGEEGKRHQLEIGHVVTKAVMSNIEYKLHRVTIYEEAKSTMPRGVISMTLVGKCSSSRLARRPRIAFIVYSMGLPTFPTRLLLIVLLRAWVTMLAKKAEHSAQPAEI
jgi:hypothetical protein